MMAEALFANPWRSFCGTSLTSVEGPCLEACAPLEELLSTGGLRAAIAFTPCLQTASISGVQLIFILTFLGSSLAFRNTIESRENRMKQRSRSMLQCGVTFFTAALGVANIGGAIWLVAIWWTTDGFAFVMQEWVYLLLQGVAWICLAFTVRLRQNPQLSTFVRVWWVVSFMLGTYAAVRAVFDTLSGHGLSTTTVLSLVSWPICCLLLYCSFKQEMKMSMETEGLTEPLLDADSSASGDRGSGARNVTPFAKAGILNLMSFWWLNSLLSLGYKSPLDPSDIPRVCKEDEAETAHNKFVQALRHQSESTGKPISVFWALASCYWQAMVMNGIFALGKSITVSLGPVVLKSFIDYTGGKRVFRYEGYVLVAGLFLAKFLESLSQRQWYFGSRRVGLQVRSALIAAIYQKDLRLSNTGRQRHAAGEVVNYMSVDAYRIGEFLYWIHFCWTTVLQICIALAILANSVGWATLAGLVVMVLTMVLNTPMARSQHRCQSQLMVAQDERLRATSEALKNMKILKLQAWEDKFKENIDSLREKEMKWLAGVQFQRTYNSMVFWLSPVFVSTATFITCIFLGTPLTASNVFTALATLRIVQEPIRLVPDILAIIIQVRVSLARLCKFLQEEELQTDAVVRDFYKTSVHAVEIENAVLSWEPHAAKSTLRNICLKVKHGEHVAVCGSVGSGKSTLIHAILAEVPKLSGVVRVAGSIAYVAQSAWIQSGTIRDNILFGRPMIKELYQKTLRACALDKDLESLPYRDMTEIGERGANMSGGQKQRLQLARAVYQDADIYLLDDPFSAVDAHTGASLFKDCIMGALVGKTVILVTHQVEFLPAVETILLMRDGEIWQAGPYDELLSAGTAFEELVTAHEDAMGGMTDTTTSVSPTALQRSSSQQVTRMPSRSPSQREADGLRAAKGADNDIQLTEKEEKAVGNTGSKAYSDYLKQANGYLYYALSTLSQIVFVAGQVGSNWWMASEVGNPATSTSRLIIVYSTTAMVTGSFVFFRSFFIALMGLAASRSFFSGLSDSLFHAPMAFFDSTPTGRILSRISSDLSIMDMDVAFAFGFSMAASTNALSNLGVNAFVTWQIMFVVIPLLFVMRRLQNYYLTSARELMRINGTTKAPVVHHFGEAIAGGATIRAFKREESFARENLDLIDANASPFFHSFAATEWLIQKLEFLSATVLSMSALLIVLLPAEHVNPGFAGLAITYGLSLNISVVFSVQHQCNLANVIISVERLKQYLNLPSEAPAIIKDKRPPTQWPNEGKVELQNLQIRYRPNAPLVLQGITCTFEGGQRVGVVGRTGSGKTTLISALFRLVEPAGGKILVDGLDITTIGLHDVRSRFGIIPQEPSLFRGTVRFNLDPLMQHTDAEVWEALDKCQLGDNIREKTERLDAPVADDGENWSVGQRQLFCLGRALLKRSRILVLDEATASIDNTTDAILQQIIRREFNNCTVITVAHRIPTVIDSDMVLALHDGRLAEFDRPTKLLENSSSMFAKLVAGYWSNANHTAHGAH